MAHVPGKVAAIFRHIGNPVESSGEPIGTGDGANKTFLLGDVLDPCDALTLWSGESLSLDTGDKKEGTGSVKNTIPAVAETYYTTWTPAEAVDLTHHRYISVWLKCSLASTAFTEARLELWSDGASHYFHDLEFSADTWTRFDVEIRNPSGSSGSPTLSIIATIRIRLDTDGTACTLKLDWLTKNPVACQNVVISDDAAVVATTEYTISPSGMVVFDTAPTAAHAITADYDYWEEIQQILGAFEWRLDWTADILDATDFASEANKEFIAGSIGWTGSADRHWEMDDLFIPGEEYIVRLYVYLDVNAPIYYEGWAKLSRSSPTVPQNEVINETLDFQGTEELFVINEV